jgi:hypothetical protein
MAKNIVFMTCFEKAPDFLDYKEWCFKTWKYWCDKNDVELFILEDELQPHGGGVMTGEPAMKPTWQRWHVFDVLDANEIEYDNVALVDIDTMIHWDCPNFFEEADGEFGAIKDRFYIEWVHNSIQGYQDFWPDVNFNWTSYFNCGFIVMNKKHKEFCKHVTEFYMIRDSKFDLKFLDERFNLTQLHLRGVLQGDLLWNTSWIWHFNGFEKTERNGLMKQVWEAIQDNYVTKK